MALGPGRYDDLCTEARLKAKAGGAILIIFGGDKGVGFSIQAPPELLVGLPDLLHGIADTIKEDIKNDLKNFPI
jgi:hypothetical protein